MPGADHYRKLVNPYLGTPSNAFNVAGALHLYLAITGDLGSVQAYKNTTALLAEDQEISTLSLGIAADPVQIVPVDEMFEH